MVVRTGYAVAKQRALDASWLRSVTRRAAAIGTVLVLPFIASAQGPIALTAGTATSVLVSPGASFSVPVMVDMTLAGASNLASLAMGVTWGASTMILDSIGMGTFGSLSSSSASGTASLALFNSTGTTSSVTLARLYFTAASSMGGTRVILAPTQAGNESGASVSAQLQVRGLEVCVAPLGLWGDVNRDNTVNIIDAQQIARFSIALPVLNSGATMAQGDVTADGSVNIIDAQQIARFSVGLVAVARVATTLPLIPTIAVVVLTPTAPTVGVGETRQLFATPVDGSGLSLTGCSTVTWNSSDPSIATVSASGVVTGISPGSVSITANSNGAVGSTTLGSLVPVSSITMLPDTATVSMGTAVQLAATLRDAQGQALGGSVTYTSSDAAVATVSGTGLVTTNAVGFASITASGGGKSVRSGIQVSPTGASSLATADDATCVLTVLGSAYCWGNNTAGQLGDGTGVSSTSPVRVAAPAGVTFTQISGTGNGFCAVSTRQAVYCWGTIPQNRASLTPVLLNSALLATTVATSLSFDCGLDAGGASWCVGRGSKGQLGTGDTLSSNVPRSVTGGLTFRSVSSGLFSSCGLLSSGAAYCWGDNSFSTLGVSGTPSVSLAPAPVTGGIAFASVRVGAVLSCGVDAAGAAYCWGTSEFGAGGTGAVTATTTLAVPSAVAGGFTFAAVFPGTGNDLLDGVCGLTADGSAYCWGANSRGQVGSTATLPGACALGTTTFSCTGTPTPVATTSRFQVLSVGAEQTCGLTTTHTLLCWGRNSAGQLGDGTTVDRGTPVSVVGGLRLP